MHWTERSKDSPLDTHPLDVVSHLWNGRSDVFPGPQPTSIERQHFEILKKKKYFICDKTDGDRYAFICCTIDDKRIACVIDRKLKCSLLHMRVPRECAKGTILDGEIIQDCNGSWIFLVYDCIAMCGKPVNTRTFEERMTYTNTFIDSYKICESDALLFQKKDMYPLERITLFLAQTRSYNTDGVILIPNDDHVRVNTHPFYFKLKNGHENTVDFYIDEKGVLFLQTKGILKKTINVIKDGSADHIPRPSVIECKYVKDREWTYCRHRTDKILPNSMYTHKKTMLNIKENIQISELQDMIGVS